ncbi:MAG: hypothetical protein JXB15_07160, partial [Anaerolineales bacterium]|nr:hypothetical protein [Anaerolineales bacterium]
MKSCIRLLAAMCVLLGVGAIPSSQVLGAPDVPSVLSISSKTSPAVIDSGQTARLTITLVLFMGPSGSISFTDTLPSGLVVASPASVTNTCGGTVTATPGASAVSLSGGLLGANGSCAITVNLTSTVPGFKRITPGSISCGAECTTGTVGTATLMVEPAGQAACSENLAPNVPTQFANLQNFGDPLAFRVGVGGTDYGILDEMPCKHYQGIVRGADANGVPYFFVTRSRNKTGACSTWGCDPGELLIVRMGSRPVDGERMRSNRLKWDQDFGDTAPPETDAGLIAKYFDGSTFSYLGESYRWPYNWHPGGTQLVDNVLIIPLECGDACDDSLCDDSGILLVDVSDPENPLPFFHQTFPTLTQGLGVVAAARAVDPNDGQEKYLFALTWGDDTTIRFAWSDSNDLRTTTSIQLASFSWTVGNLDKECGACQWRQWQVFNFVRDTGGDLYLLLGDNDNPDVVYGDDWIGLARVVTSKLTAAQYGDAIVYLQERHISVNDAEPDMGDLDAAGGWYVSPTGQLLLYTADHRGFSKEGAMSVEMGEFSTRDLTYSAKCGLEWPAELSQVHYLSPGQGLLLHGARYIEPWVRLFEDTSYNGLAGAEERQVLTVDWRYNSNYRAGGECDDYTCDEYHNFDSGGIDLFNDKLSSFSWCGVAGATMTI